MSEDQATKAPATSVILGTAAMLPIVVGSALSLAVADLPALLIHAVILWAATVLCFLGGVRRGLSFRQNTGPTVRQLVTSLWLFVCGMGAIATPWPALSLALLLVGYGSVAILDPLAARRAEVPRYFAHFRPWQMAFPILGLLLVLGRLELHSGVDFFALCQQTPAPQQDCPRAEDF